jgi:hypothetical protein
VVAVVSGDSLGLLNTSLHVLGAQGYNLAGTVNTAGSTVTRVEAEQKRKRRHE